MLKRKKTAVDANAESIKKDIKAIHAQNLHCFTDKDFQPYKDYYMMLYKEAIAPTQEEKLSLALEFIKEAKLRGEKVTFERFRNVTMFSATFDEAGQSYADKNKHFFQNEDGTRTIKDALLDEMIRDPVHSILKYGGSLKALATSPYFRYLVQYSEIYYKASPKALFYLIYECSPNFQPALMS